MTSDPVRPGARDASYPGQSVMWRRPRRLWLAAIMASQALLLTACGSDDGAAPASARTAPQSSDRAPIAANAVVAPTITAQPADATVAPGAGVRFTVAASGGALAYTWESSADGVAWTTVASQPGVAAFGYGGVATADGSNVNDIPGASGATLTLSAVSQSDHGRKFRVVVANSAGAATSRVATLTVNASAQGTLSLLAGALGGPGSFDGQGSGARFFFPTGVAIDSGGNVYVGDQGNHTIRRIDVNGNVTTFAGAAGEPGSADGRGAAARFYVPVGVAVDAGGNVYVADSLNHTVRKIDPSGNVATLAGAAGQSGTADGQGAAARFFSPHGVAVDAGGTVYVADLGNHTIRKIDRNGNVSTLAGSASQSGCADGLGGAARFALPRGLAVDAAGNVYVADTYNHTIRKIDRGGNVATIAGAVGQPGSADGVGAAARFESPYAVAADAAGSVYVADAQNHTIRKIDSGGAVTTYAGAAGQFGAVDGQGAAARFSLPYGVAVDAAGTVYVASTFNHTLRRIDAARNVSTLAGLADQAGAVDGRGSAGRFNSPGSLVTDGSGNTYVADTFNHTIRKIDSGGNVTTLAGRAGQPGWADGQGTAARFNAPQGLARDTAGNLYVSDFENHTIRKIDSAGNVTTLAGARGLPGSADGMGSAARFYYPYGLAVDGSGNLYVADSFNHTIRKIDPSGRVATPAGTALAYGADDGRGAAARFGNPYGVAVDAQGNVYVADTYNSTIRKIDPGGNVVTVAGRAGAYGFVDGTGAAARFGYPWSVAVDTSGNLFVADTLNHALRRIDGNGSVTTVVGGPTRFGVRPGTGAQASLGLPYGAVVLDAGRLVVTDENSVLIFTLP